MLFVGSQLNIYLENHKLLTALILLPFFKIFFIYIVILSLI